MLGAMDTMYQRSRIQDESMYYEHKKIAGALVKEPVNPCECRDRGNQHLRAFSGHSDDSEGIPYALGDYLELVDWAGRAIRSDKKGYIPADTPPILSRLGLVPGEVVDFLHNKQDFPRAIGPVDQIRIMALKLGRAFIKGTAISRRLYANPA